MPTSPGLVLAVVQMPHCLKDFSPHSFSPFQPRGASISQNLSTLQLGYQRKFQGQVLQSLFPAGIGERAGRDFPGPSPACSIFLPQKLTFPHLSYLTPSCCYSQREPRGRKIYNSILISWYVALCTEIALSKLGVHLRKSPVNFSARYHPEGPGFCVMGNGVTLRGWIAYLFM